MNKIAKIEWGILLIIALFVLIVFLMLVAKVNAG